MQPFSTSKNILLLLLVICTILSWQCKTTKKTSENELGYNDSLMGHYKNFLEQEPAEYQAARTRVNDLIHTKLNLKFDIPNATVFGEASLTFKPHFYPTGTIDLDAVGFKINKASLEEGKKSKELKYNYDGKVLSIDLGNTYSRNDTVRISISYVAYPDSLEYGGSLAIMGNKGLYFINKDGKQKGTPTQVWSQGETQANSKWFPTIDAPNQRMTQEISLTVDNKYTTLSNGLLISQKNNNDGTRTDYWKQSLPAAPYLTMIAIGEFVVVKDKYKDKEVSYYMEPAYAKYARHIFGMTPDMIAYFEKLLGFPYVWEKYSQVAVREYISGAMENTTATVHGDFVLKTDRELIDENSEDVIAHELFHHWFGDLVTCESWSNLALNESFATYAEYLWFNHRHGVDAANELLFQDLNSYLAESKYKKEKIVRYHYNDKEDMFDSHSYAKGGLVLHMLRNYVGDDAFFEALNLYLNKRKFNTAELADLRMAFEEITGEDLNWFFNQWFLEAGHPMIKVVTTYNDTTKKVNISINQFQSSEVVFKLPVAVDVYTSTGKKRHKITLEKAEETFSFDCESRPYLVSFDGDYIILGQVFEEKSEDEWIYQLKHAGHLRARLSAVKNLNTYKDDKAFNSLYDAALNDKYFLVRKNAAEALLSFKGDNNSLYQSKLKQCYYTQFSKDESSIVRANALDFWFDLVKDEKTFSKDPIVKATKDQSYFVQSTALSVLYEADQDLGFETAKKFENDSSYLLVSEIARIYSQLGSENENTFFVKNINRITGFNKYEIIDAYGNYLLRSNEEVINQGIEILAKEARENNIWYIKLNAFNKLKEISQMYADREAEFEKQSNKQEQYVTAKSQKEKLEKLMDSIVENEKSNSLLRMYRN